MMLPDPTPEEAGQALRDQSHDGGQVAQTQLGGRSTETGPKEPKSSVLSIEDEAIIVAFRRHTLLPRDACLYALQPTIPHLTRSSCCLQRHGISQLPAADGEKPVKKKFKVYPMGFFHIDIAEVRTEEGKLHLFVAIDRTSKFAFVELYEKATTKIAADYLRHLIAAVPYKITQCLPTTSCYKSFDFRNACKHLGLQHMHTRPYTPKINGKAEQFVQTSLRE